MEGEDFFSTLVDRTKRQLSHMLREICSTEGASAQYAAAFGTGVFLNKSCFFDAQHVPGGVAQLRYCPLKQGGYPISLEEDEKTFPEGAFAVQCTPEDVAYNLFQLIDARVVAAYANEELEREIAELKIKQEALSKLLK